MRRSTLALALTLGALLAALPLTAAPEGPGTLSMERSAEGLAFAVPTSAGGAVLTVTGPGGWSFRKAFGTGEAPRFDLPTDLADGPYTFELRSAPRVDAATREALAQARRLGEEATAATVRRLQADGTLPRRPQVLAGTFTVTDGALVSDRLVEGEPPRTPRLEAGPFGSEALRARGAGDAFDPTNLSAADVRFIDDVLISFSLCIGTACSDGESFGSDSIRIKEPNTRIKFHDTSSSTFPGNDWQLTANDSASGGANKFSIDDVTGGTVPFTVEAGAGDHSLYVDDAGRLGFGTAVPVVKGHFVDGNTPALRLQQDGSSGFTAQTWDVGGNETNFFVRDVTHGSKFPFRIKPDAPAESLHIAADGDVGMGTPGPQAGLHVLRGGSEAVRDLLQLTNNGRVRWRLEDTSADGQILTVRLAEGDLDFSFSGTAGDQVEMKSNGNMVIQGTLTEMSDRSRKTGITPVEPGEILEKVLELPIAHWRQRDGDPSVRHLGPMAQDFYSLFGLGVDDRHIATIDTSGVALAAIQGLHRELLAKTKELESVHRRLEALEAQLAR